MKAMEAIILYSLRVSEYEVCITIAHALKSDSLRELLDIWLHYEGIFGYTDQILNVMEALGFEVFDKVDDPDLLIILDQIIED